MRRAGGVVRVSSEPGQGTTVKLYLPSLDTEETPAESDRMVRGSGTVLVAEDEEGVRRLIRKILEEQGYSVLDARHGKDAVLMAAAARRPIDLLVTDVVMPEMNGPELVEALAGRYPDLKVLYISGYTNEEVVRRGVTATDPAFVQKPFTAADLMRKVRELLASPHPATETA